MANFQTFNSGCHAPGITTFLHEDSQVQKGRDVQDEVLMGGFNVSIEALRQQLGDFSIRSPPGLAHWSENYPDGNAQKSVTRDGAFSPVLQSPLRPPERRGVCHQKQKTWCVSKGSVGHPKSCAPACKFVKRKAGCRLGTDCDSCHLCFWSRPHEYMDAQKEELFAGVGSEHVHCKKSQSLKNGPVCL